jgi:hypothetical protein
LYFGYNKRGTLNQSSWYDFHARTTARPIETSPLFLRPGQELGRANVRMPAHNIGAISV